MLAGAGETTCANTRCEHHNGGSQRPPSLTTLEVPFAYTERGEAKSALVKAVLCGTCTRKLMWKRRKEKERLLAEAGVVVKEEEVEAPLDGRNSQSLRERNDGDSREERRHRKRSSRSRSPRRRQDGERPPR